MGTVIQIWMLHATVAQKERQSKCMKAGNKMHEKRTEVISISKSKEYQTKEDRLERSEKTSKNR